MRGAATMRCKRRLACAVADFAKLALEADLVGAPMAKSFNKAYANPAGLPHVASRPDGETAAGFVAGVPPRAAPT